MPRRSRPCTSMDTEASETVLGSLRWAAAWTVTRLWKQKARHQAGHPIRLMAVTSAARSPYLFQSSPLREISAEAVSPAAEAGHKPAVTPCRSRKSIGQGLCCALTPHTPAEAGKVFPPAPGGTDSHIPRKFRGSIASAMTASTTA